MRSISPAASSSLRRLVAPRMPYSTSAWMPSRCRSALGVVRPKVGEPVFVNAQHLAGGFVIVETAGGAEDAVQHLGLDAVAVLVLQAQIGVREPAYLLLLGVVEPGRGHAVGAVDLARLVFAAGRTHAGVEPEGGAVLGDPFAAARALGDEGHAVLEGGRSV